MVHTFNSSTQEAETARSLRVQGHPGLRVLGLGQPGWFHREILPQNTKQNKNKNKAKQKRR